MAGNAQKKERLFQDGKDSLKEPSLYRGGQDARDHDNRPTFPPVLQKLLNALDERNKNRCENSCIIPEPMKSNLGGIQDAVLDVGKDNFKRGVAVSRNTINNGAEFFRFNKGLLKTALTWIVYAVVIVTIALVISGKVNLRVVR
jgi:hypothetical protein